MQIVFVGEFFWDYDEFGVFGQFVFLMLDYGWFFVGYMFNGIMGIMVIV